MAKFGRFEFKAKEPAETYEGDRMELDKSYVKIFRGLRNRFDPTDFGKLVVVIHLDKGQSVREIERGDSDEDKSVTKRKRR